MPRQRPAAVLVIAILHFVFGGAGLLCSICSGVTDLVGFPQSQAASPEQAHRKQITEKVLSQRIPLYQAYTVGNRISSLLSCVLMIASGVGLLLMQSWGRWLSVVYAVLSLFMNLIVFVYTIAFFMPAYEEVFRQLPPQNEQERMALPLAKAGGPVGACILMIYPAVVLIVMLLPSVGAAFRRRKKRRRFLYDDE